MMKDAFLTFSDAQAITAAAVSTNVIDTGVANRGIGDGEHLELVIQVETTVAATGGASNGTFHLRDCATEGGSYRTVLATRAIPKAELVAGFEVLRTKLPAGLQRYLQVYYVPDTNDFTSGKFDAFIVKDRQNNRAMAPGFTVT